MMTNNVPEGRRQSRGKRLMARFDEVEARQVKEFAEAKGVGISALVRASVLDAVEGRGGERVGQAIEYSAKPAEGDTTTKEESRRLRTEVNRVGVLFNQTVRRVNTDGAGVLNDERVLEQLVEVGKVLREVQESLGGSRWPS